MADEKNTAVTPAPKAAGDKAAAGRANRGFHSGNGRPQGGRNQGHGARGREADPFQDQVVSINKVTKVEKGGKHMRFAALVVIGDGKGTFGFGQGKSAEVPVAIRKALDYAHNTTIKLPMTKDKTIPHEVIGKCGVCRVFLKPAPSGTGIIAGGAVRQIMQLAGIKNIYSKVYGRRTPINVVRATIDAVKQLKTREYVERVRFGTDSKKTEEAE